MLFKCKLISDCLDCKNAHLDVFNELVRPSGSLVPETIASTLYCKHQNVCKVFQEAMEGDHLVMVPLSHFMETYGENDKDSKYNILYGEGDGINE